MKTEPTAIAEGVRALAIFASFFGVAINADEQAVLVAGVGGALAAASIAIAVWNRLKVFSPASVKKIAAEAARTGNPTVGDPPAGELPASEPPVDVDHGDYP